MSPRPRIVGYAIVSREGMIANSDGSFPDELRIPADQKFYQDSLAHAAAVANGRHSTEGGPREAARKRIVLSRRVQRIVHHPENANAILWNPARAPFEEAWQKLGIAPSPNDAPPTLAVVGGTDVFGLFLTLGYDAFFLTRTRTSIPRGRPVFPGVDLDTPPDEVLRKQGLALKSSRVLDEETGAVLEEWVRT